MGPDTAAPIASDVMATKKTQSPYQIDADQVADPQAFQSYFFADRYLQSLKASTALLRHVRQEAKRLEDPSGKKSLLDNVKEDDGSDSEGPPAENPPIWLNLTTKKHMVDKTRLKPSRIVVPHSINSSPSLTICLITADPQRGVKDVISDPSFPTSLSARIGRIIGFSKLKAKYRTFESRRQLLAEHDIFLADDRIISRLVEALGKIFYKDTAKRPIPIRINKIEKVDGKRVKSSSKQEASSEAPTASIASPSIIAKEIESAINAVPVSLRPGTSAAVRVGRASFTAQQLSDNIRAVAEAMIDRFVARGWRNIKAIHIKSPNSAALPIWLADDLWVADEDVIRDSEAIQQQERVKVEKREKKIAKRKRKGQAEGDGGHPEGHKKFKQADEIQEKDQRAARKAKLAEQKACALEASP